MPARRFGQYEVLARLATGGAANIFLARQPGAGGFKTLVCLKTLLPERAADHEFVEMFVDEARLAARLAHPNCVEIYDLGKEAGTYYISMEYILGETLWGLLSTVAEVRAPLPPLVVATILASACEGLHHAHELLDPQGRPYNLVHRDISPQNIMVSYEGQTKVLDFGIVKAETGREATATGIVKGKFSYMSPEQITGGAIDRRSDIYSLGIVMFECLASRRLYRAETPEEIARMMLERRPPKLRDLVPDVDPTLEGICSKALSRHPNNRFATARDMADAIREYLHGERFPDGTAPVARLVEERFAQRIVDRRRIFTSALEGTYDEQELLQVLNARPVMELDLFPQLDQISSEPLAPDPTEALAPEALERVLKEPPRRDDETRAKLIVEPRMPRRIGGSLEELARIEHADRSTMGRSPYESREPPSIGLPKQDDPGASTVIELEGDHTEVPDEEVSASSAAATHLGQQRRPAPILESQVSGQTSRFDLSTEPELESSNREAQRPAVPEARRLKDPALTRPLPKASDPIPAARPRVTSQPRSRPPQSKPPPQPRRSEPPPPAPRNPRKGLPELAELPTFDHPVSAPQAMSGRIVGKPQPQEHDGSSSLLVARHPQPMSPPMPEAMALPVAGPPSETGPAAVADRTPQPVEIYDRAYAPIPPQPMAQPVMQQPGFVQQYSLGVVVAALAFGVTLGLLIGVLLTLFR